jgi:hypothetical protein
MDDALVRLFLTCLGPNHQQDEKQWLDFTGGVVHTQI